MNIFEAKTRQIEMSCVTRTPKVWCPSYIGQMHKFLNELKGAIEFEIHATMLKHNLKIKSLQERLL